MGSDISGLPKNTSFTSQSSGSYEPVGGASPHTTEMALRSSSKLVTWNPWRSPGQVEGQYVSTVTNDDFATFRQNGHGQDHEDEEIDFTPQNGYIEPEEMDTEEVDDGRTKAQKKAAAARKAKPDLLGKIAAAGSAIKKARLPTAGELKDGYLNSAFHKSLHQPLIVKAKVEKDSVRVARQALTQEKSPTQLANIESVSDIPIPKVFASKPENGEVTESGEGGMTLPRNMDEFGQAAFNTLPRSLREQNIVTAVKENLDPEELARNQELTRSKTPAELSQITSLSEFPVPDNIKSFLTWEKKEEEETEEKKETKKRRHSESEPEEPVGPPEPFSLYATLPRSLRETKLVTVVKEEDQEVVQANQELVQTHTPAQLAAIACLADIPIPTKLTRLMETRDHSAHNGTNGAVVHDGEKMENGDVKSPSKLNLNDMYATLPKSLPKSLTMDLAVSSVVEDQNMVEQNRKLTQEKSVLELSKIGSISDLPIPTPISNLFHKTPGESKTPGEVAADDTPTRPKRRNMEEKRKRNLTTGTFLSADFVPPSWIETKIECSRIVEDPDVVKARQDLVSGKSVSELGQIHGLDDFPVPDKIQSLLRKKRVLKSTEEKESLRAGIARSLTSLSTKSITSLGMPDSLKCQLAVKSVVEDQELVAKNKETVKTKSVGELSAIGALSEIPIPDNIENIYKTITEKLQRLRIRKLHLRDHPHRKATKRKSTILCLG